MAFKGLVDYHHNVKHGHEHADSDGKDDENSLS